MVVTISLAGIPLLDLLQGEVEFVCDLRAGRDDFDREIGTWSAIGGLVNHENTEGEARVGPLFGRELVLEGIHHRFDMARQRGGLFQQGALIGAEGDELQGDRKAAFEGVLRAEQVLDGVVEIDAASLQLGAHRVVYPAGRAVLDFMPQFQQEG